MEKVKVFTYSYMDRLFNDSTNDPDLYLQERISFSDECYAKGETGLTLENGIIEKINNSISTSGSSKEDADNSIRIYEALDINLTTASDPRLWTCLTHDIFWDYMKMRWPLVSLDREKMKSRIKDRYHLRNLSLNNMSRNGMARLWWIAYLTVDEERKDKFELTKVLASRQDLIAGLLERVLGSNENIRRSILQFLLENNLYLEKEVKRRDLLKKINLLGGVKNLPLLTRFEIKEQIRRIA
ncbi:MAG: DUF6339 family protein [Cyclobacteriaceae bacterium]